MAVPDFDDDARRRRVVATHRLAAAHRSDDVEAIVESLVALHASDPATVFLSAMTRMADPSVPAIEAALYERRSLIRHHAMRRTIFVFPVATAIDAHWSSTVDVAEREATRFARFLEETGTADDGFAWMSAARPRILEEIDRRGTTTTRAIGQALPELARTIEVQGARISTHSRLLLVMGLEGAVVRGRPLGTWISSQYRWTTMRSAYPGTIDPEAPVDPDEAAARLVGRYLRSFGPVTTSDVAWWTGWGKTRARGVLEAAGAVPVAVSDGPAWLAPDDDGDVPDADDEPAVSFLPGLDATIMGWKERRFLLSDAAAGRLFDANGNAGPTIWLDGRVVGGWVQLSDGTIRTEVVEPAAEGCAELIAAEAERVRGLFGDVRHKVRFPTPLQQDHHH